MKGARDVDDSATQPGEKEERGERNEPAVIETSGTSDGDTSGCNGPINDCNGHEGNQTVPSNAVCDDADVREKTSGNVTRDSLDVSLPDVVVEAIDTSEDKKSRAKKDGDKGELKTQVESRQYSLGQIFRLCACSQQDSGNKSRNSRTRTFIYRRNAATQTSEDSSTTDSSGQQKQHEKSSKKVKHRKDTNTQENKDHDCGDQENKNKDSGHSEKQKKGSVKQNNQLQHQATGNKENEKHTDTGKQGTRQKSAGRNAASRTSEDSSTTDSSGQQKQHQKSSKKVKHRKDTNTQENKDNDCGDQENKNKDSGHPGKQKKGSGKQNNQLQHQATGNKENEKHTDTGKQGSQQKGAGSQDNQNKDIGIILEKREAFLERLMKLNVFEICHRYIPQRGNGPYMYVCAGDGCISVIRKRVESNRFKNFVHKKQYTCHVCYQSFGVDHLELHITSHRKEGVNKNRLEKMERIDEKEECASACSFVEQKNDLGFDQHAGYKPYVCLVCNMSFTHVVPLKIHVNVKHARRNARSNTPVKEDKDGANDHRKNDNNDNCGQLYADYEKVLLYECEDEDCQKQFFHQKLADRHFYNTHVSFRCRKKRCKEKVFRDYLQFELHRGHHREHWEVVRKQQRRARLAEQQRRARLGAKSTAQSPEPSAPLAPGEEASAPQSPVTESTAPRSTTQSLRL